ncbi:MAG: CorA family divalent cation transporter [Pseudonocardiaceae bacterium]
MAVVDNAVYVQGRRTAEPDTLDHAWEVLRDCSGDGSSFCWIGMLRPTAQEITAVAAQRQNDEITRLTEATYQQSEQVKRISSWAAVLFAPTLVGTVYGMNFTHMPELDWVLGYPFAVALMVLTALALRFMFKRRGWL